MVSPKKIAETLKHGETLMKGKEKSMTEVRNITQRLRCGQS